MEPAICRVCFDSIMDQNLIWKRQAEEENSQDYQRKCTYCLRTKSIREWHQDRAKKGNGSASLEFICVVCFRIYRRATDQRRRQPLTDFINSQKRGRSCTDCGNLWPFYVMDFDHRDPSTKLFNVSQMIFSHCERSKWGEVLDEIEKCDLVCKNCHIIRSRAGGHLGRMAVDMSPEDTRARRARQL